MKNIALAVLLLSASSWAGLNPDPAAYTSTVHVSASRMTTRGDSAYVQYLKVVIDGKKYELESSYPPNKLLALGDYKAKLVKDEHPTAYDSLQVYEFLLPDQKTRRFRVVGQTE